MASGNVRSSAIALRENSGVDQSKRGASLPLFSRLWVNINIRHQTFYMSHFCVNQINFLLFALPEPALKNVYRSNILLFATVHWHRLDLTGNFCVLREREEREKREAPYDSGIGHHSPHSGSGAHYHLPGAAHLVSVSSHEPLSLITVSHFLSHILRLLVIVLTQCDC